MKRRDIQNIVCNEVVNEKGTNNRVNIDWLSLNFKGVDAYTLLETFCNSTKHEDIDIKNFVYNERGIVTGYSESYSYMDTPYIVVSFCSDRDSMGVNIQITGQGCKLVYIDDIKRFLIEMSEYTNDYKCNRLDIAYDDFDRVIPVKEMIEATERELDPTNGISTIISRIKRDMISIYTNHWNGMTSKNLLYGKHRSARSFRLYDKKLEQKVSDEECKYWYRLEIELRTKGKSTNADDAFKSFISGESSIFDLFLYNISSIVTFVQDMKVYIDGFKQCHQSNINISIFWQEFITTLTSHNTYYAK